MDRLRELTKIAALFRPPLVSEAKSPQGDLAGVLGTLDDCLADLHDNLKPGGKLEAALKALNALRAINANKDNDGKTPLQHITQELQRFETELNNLRLIISFEVPQE